MMFDAKSLLDGLLGGQGQAGQAGGLGAVLGNLVAQAQAQADKAGLGQAIDRARERGVGGVASDAFNQATGGLKDAASQLDQRTGASTKLNDIVSQLSGKSPAELIAQAKELAMNNPAAATAALGGLAAAIFGTGAGRGLAANAAKLGGLALIGGLAYRAWQNHQSGKPLLELQQQQQPQLLPAPSGSGFEPAAATNDTAMALIRAMIAAAAADGHVDAAERAAIMGRVKDAGFNAEANSWLEQQIARPASIDELAATAKGSPQLAAQIYAAARLTIEPDQQRESSFLKELASGLSLPDELAAQIDAAAVAARADA